MGTLDTFRLDGKVAIVTGGARTLGYDMADALAEAGCSLVITSRELAKAEKSAERLRKERKVEVLPMGLDQCQYPQVAEMAKRALAWKGRIDILINNAGGGTPGENCRFFERAPEHMADLIARNLTGVLYCCREVGKTMVKQRSGKIINIASIAGMVGRDRRMYARGKLMEQPPDYAAAKGGVISFTRDLAAILAPYGVYANAISPGGFERGQPPEFIKAYSDATALGRMGRDGIDLKGAALFLASPASDYVTGQNLAVDGGFCMFK